MISDREVYLLFEGSQLFYCANRGVRIAGKERESRGEGVNKRGGKGGSVERWEFEKWRSGVEKWI